MSNYTIVTNFVSKDSLASGNPLKLVKGADFTTEFTAVQTALNTKFDGVVQFAPDGTAAAPAFGFTNNTGTGMFNAAGVLGFATGGVLRIGITAAGVATVTGIANSNALTVTSPATSGQSLGPVITAGTTSADFSIRALNAAATAEFLKISGDGSGHIGPSSTAGLSWASGGSATFAAPTSGDALTINGLSAANALRVNGGATTGSSFGLSVVAGTNASDAALRIFDATAATSFLTIAGTGGMVLGSASGGQQGLGTINALGLYIAGVNVIQTGSFTGTLTGCSTAPTATFNWAQTGNQITVWCAAGLSATSNTAGLSVTGSNAPFSTNSGNQSGMNTALDSGAYVTALLTVGSGVLALGKAVSGLAWTSTGNKGIPARWSATYSI